MSNSIVKAAHALAIATLMAVAAPAARAQPQPTGITRTDLQRHDLSVPGHDVDGTRHHAHG